MSAIQNVEEVLKRVQTVRPQLPVGEIAKALVKLRKITSTLRSRYSIPYVGPQFDKNTESFLLKGEKLARDLGGLLEYVPADDSFILHVDHVSVRIL